MIDQVHPRDLAHWLETVAPHGRPLVLDVREPHEWQMASVKADGFEMQAIPMRAVPVRMNELDASRPVACLCHHGGAQHAGRLVPQAPRFFPRGQYCGWY
jgi:rhodanese-related sulfurtransferase